jgi:hypothetical protein
VTATPHFASEGLVDEATVEPQPADTHARQRQSSGQQGERGADVKTSCEFPQFLCERSGRGVEQRREVRPNGWVS